MLNKSSNRPCQPKQNLNTLCLPDEAEEKELKHDIELIGKESPSGLAQPREQEIDMNLNLEEFIYVTERLLGEDPHP